MIAETLPVLTKNRHLQGFHEFEILQHIPGGPVLVIRDIMYCKPGKVRPMVKKLQALSKLSAGKGMGSNFRIMTDLSAERFWTVVTEFEVPSVESFMNMDGMSEADQKQVEEIMKDYHDLVDHGRREIYTLEA